MRYRKRHPHKDFPARSSRSLSREDEIKKLNRLIESSTPPPGHTLPLTPTPTPFSALPISQSTLTALTSSSFTEMSDIQRSCIPHALAGRDILASARTGSGKTLAFLIPLLESLYRNHVAHTPTVAAIVLSPTRELTTQIFAVLRDVGRNHPFSACLLIGGKNEFNKEKLYVPYSNILIATPGRLLQHFEQSPHLDLFSLRMLVLDEADRILDLGFKVQLNRILEYLPTEGRQTLLFSATQTKKVNDLGRLSLKHPEHIFVHNNTSDENDDKAAVVLSSAPTSLQQMYVTVPLQHKLDVLYSFLKSHLQSKVIIFFSTCSQVRHAYVLFNKLQPGISLFSLHGKMNQEARSRVFKSFSDSKHAALLATDLASRGLDFPQVHWVLNVDAPDTKEEYIHRIGRTARYANKGKSLLILLPHEEAGFMSLLQEANILPRKWGMNPHKLFRIGTPQIAGSIAARDFDVAFRAKKAFYSYCRSYSFMPQRTIFDFEKLDLEEYAKSLGLMECPDLTVLMKWRGMSREEAREVKNEDMVLKKLKEEIREERLMKKEKKGLKVEKKKKEEEMIDTEEEEEDDLLVVKRKIDWTEQHRKEPLMTTTTTTEVAPAKKQKQEKRIQIHTINTRKITFDEDGKEKPPLLEVVQKNAETEYRTELSERNDEYMQKVKARLEKTKTLDKEEQRRRTKEMHRKYRLKEKDQRIGEKEMGEDVAVLGVPEEEVENDSSSSAPSSSSSSSSESDSSSESESDSSSESEEEMDVKAQENIAISMIRGSHK